MITLNKKLSLSLFVTANLLAFNSFAASTPCNLFLQPVPAELKMSKASVDAYKAKLKNECTWMQQYNLYKADLQTKYKVTPEIISEYQAMRFIVRRDFESAKKYEVPVEVIYQMHKEDYSKPNDQKSPVIWDNWIDGIKQLEPTIALVKSGKPFTLELLKEIHVNFFHFSDEQGDYARAPQQGKMKPGAAVDNYWWDFPLPTKKENEEEAAYQARVEKFKTELAEAQKNVIEINRHYNLVGLLPKKTDPNFNYVLDVREADRRGGAAGEKVQAVYGGQTKANPTHLANILNFMNTMMRLALNNKPLIWNKQIFTPAEAAFLVQKFYIGVHAFYEGNGRTGRLMQELMLAITGLPHGSSGDLMDYDVLSTFTDYYNRAMTANLKLNDTLKSCLDTYSTQSPEFWLTTDQKQINYSCRILKTK